MLTASDLAAMFRQDLPSFFVGTILCTIGLGFAVFLIETRVGSKAVRIRSELLQHSVEEAE